MFILLIYWWNCFSCVHILDLPLSFPLEVDGEKGKSYDSVWIMEFLKNLKPEIKVLGVRLESKELTKHSY